MRELEWAVLRALAGKRSARVRPRKPAEPTANSNHTPGKLSRIAFENKQAPPAISHLLARSHTRPRLTEPDQETWRLLLDRTASLLSQHAQHIHPSYVAGFELLFGQANRIPDDEELNLKLAQFGWRTVLVDGYLPHDVYAGLLAACTFPVARKIRSRRDVEHSPVPDLAHDLLGHLPMLVDERHRSFLQRIGAEMSRSTPDARDRRLYTAQRRAGTLRQSEPPPSPIQIRTADAKVTRVEEQLAHAPSTIARLSRLYLWTIEFGLIGPADDWVAYGAALMSSGRELQQLMAPNACVLPLSSEVVEKGISFCDPQPCYYRAKDHAELDAVLDEVLLGD